jgi:hypothetical protein
MFFAGMAAASSRSVSLTRARNLLWLGIPADCLAELCPELLATAAGASSRIQRIAYCPLSAIAVRSLSAQLAEPASSCSYFRTFEGLAGRRRETLTEQTWATAVGA